MIRALFRDSSPPTKIMFSLFIIVVGFTLFTVVGMLSAMFFYGLGIEELSGKIDPNNPENVPVLKLLQSCFSIGLFLFPPFIIALLFHGKPGEYLKLNARPAIYTTVLAISLVICATPLVNFLAGLNENVLFPESMKGMETLFKGLENEAQQTTDSFLKSSGPGGLIVNLFVIALIPALGEELLFRGVFQRLFHEWTKNIHFAIFISSFIFSVLHLQFYGTLPRLVLGMLFGYLFYWSKNLWLPIIAHFVNNATAVVIYHMQGNIAEKAENIGTGSGTGIYAAISAVCVAAILFFIYKIGLEDHKKEQVQP